MIYEKYVSLEVLWAMKHGIRAALLLCPAADVQHCHTALRTVYHLPVGSSERPAGSGKKYLYCPPITGWFRQWEPPSHVLSRSLFCNGSLKAGGPLSFVLPLELHVSLKGMEVALRTSPYIYRHTYIHIYIYFPGKGRLHTYAESMLNYWPCLRFQYFPGVYNFFCLRAEFG